MFSHLIVILCREMHACDWSKWCHVTCTKSDCSLMGEYVYAYVYFKYM